MVGQRPNSDVVCGFTWTVKIAQNQAKSKVCHGLPFLEGHYYTNQVSSIAMAILKWLKLRSISVHKIFRSDDIFHVTSKLLYVEAKALV